MPEDELEPVAVTVQPVISGNRETGYQAVVAIVVDYPGGVAQALCSGSLIGPYQVMTAKHCVFDEQSNKELPPSSFRVFEADNLRDQKMLATPLKVKDVRTTPGTDINAAVENGDDIAILLLSTRADVMPLPTSDAEPKVGAPVTIVGFGRTKSGFAQSADAGVKYSGKASVMDIEARLIQAGGKSAACEGDSGGPLLDADGKIIGIVSAGPDATCYSGTGIYTRVSTHQDLISSVLAWSPTCTDAKPETCNGMDDNCDGVVDEGCLGTGMACTSDKQCKGGMCRSVDGKQVCSNACDPTAQVSSCAMGELCRQTGCGTGQCVLGSAGSSADGTVCTADEQCESGHCGSAHGMRLCGRACRAGGCAIGTVCDTSDAAGGGCGLCLPPNLSSTSRPFGTTCDANAECDSGACLGAATAGGVCTRTCSAGAACGSGFHCRGGLCVAGSLGTSGAACIDATDCGSMAPQCVAVGADHVCAPACDAAHPCSTGFACMAVAGGASSCVRKGAELGEACGIDADCNSSDCRSGRCVRGCSISMPCPAEYHCSASGATLGVCESSAPAMASSQADLHGGFGCRISRFGGSNGACAGCLPLFAVGFWFLSRRARRRVASTLGAAPGSRG